MSSYRNHSWLTLMCYALFIASYYVLLVSAEGWESDGQAVTPSGSPISVSQPAYSTVSIEVAVSPISEPAAQVSEQVEYSWQGGSSGSLSTPSAVELIQKFSTSQVNNNPPTRGANVQTIQELPNALMTPSTVESTQETSNSQINNIRTTHEGVQTTQESNTPQAPPQSPPASSSSHPVSEGSSGIKSPSSPPQENSSSLESILQNVGGVPGTGVIVQAAQSSSAPAAQPISQTPPMSQPAQTNSSSQRLSLVTQVLGSSSSVAASPSTPIPQPPPSTPTPNPPTLPSPTQSISPTPGSTSLLPPSPTPTGNPGVPSSFPQCTEASASATPNGPGGVLPVPTLPVSSSVTTISESSFIIVGPTIIPVNSAAPLSGITTTTNNTPFVVIPSSTLIPITISSLTGSVPSITWSAASTPPFTPPSPSLNTISRHKGSRIGMWIGIAIGATAFLALLILLILLLFRRRRRRSDSHRPSSPGVAAMSAAGAGGMYGTLASTKENEPLRRDTLREAWKKGFVPPLSSRENLMTNDEGVSPVSDEAEGRSIDALISPISEVGGERRSRIGVAL